MDVLQSYDSMAEPQLRKCGLEGISLVSAGNKLVWYLNRENAMNRSTQL